MKKFIPFVVILGIIIAINAILILNKKENANTPNTPGTTKACTEEAKLCPDGTAVGRTGPNCEFAACPGVNTTSTATPSDQSQNPEGKQLVYFRSAKQDGLSAIIEVDPIEIFNGEEAIQAAMKDTGCARQNVASGKCAPSLNNGFYIRNSSTTTEKYTVTLSTEAYLISTTDTSVLEKVGPFELKKRYDAGDLTGLRSSPFWLTVEDGKVLKIEQQYIP